MEGLGSRRWCGVPATLHARARLMRRAWARPPGPDLRGQPDNARRHMTVAQRPQDQHRPNVLAAPGLVRRLGDALAAHAVPYCQWKGSRRPERWLTGAGDIDLLVDRTARPQLRQVLGALGFKPVEGSSGLTLLRTGRYLG